MTNVSELLQRWERHRNVLEEVLGKIDDEYLHFTPWDGGMPLSTLILHIADSIDMLIAKLQQIPFASSAPIDAQSMDEVKEYIRQATENTYQNFQGLKDAELEAIIEVNGHHDSGENWLSTAIDHEIHHKGQVFTYARIVGVESVPFFIEHHKKNSVI